MSAKHFVGMDGCGMKNTGGFVHTRMRSILAVGVTLMVLAGSHAWAQTCPVGSGSPPGCTANCLNGNIDTPTISARHGDKVCYTVDIFNGGPPCCDVAGVDATLNIGDPDGSGIALSSTTYVITTNAYVARGAFFTCPGVDSRCVTPGNCTIPGGFGYEYTVTHDDEHGATGDSCPPTPVVLFGGGEISAFVQGAGTLCREIPTGVNLCKSIAIDCPHGACCEPCSGTCSGTGTCNECPGNSIFTPDGDCSVSCLLTCGDNDACTTDGVCLPGGGRNNCAVSPGGTPATCAPDVHVCIDPPPGFTCEDGLACTVDECADDLDPATACCSRRDRCPTDVRCCADDPVGGATSCLPPDFIEVCGTHCNAAGCCEDVPCRCGDGIFSPPPHSPREYCDGTQFEAGAPPTHGLCRTDCTYCGNGTPESPETCDDGNAVNTDACRNDCTSCGDGIWDIVEDCDGTQFEPGAPPTHGLCRTDCTYCGNGAVEAGETCDDGNAVDTDACRNNCTSCGDGILNSGEDCDGTQFEVGAPPTHGTCRTNCTYCGNGAVEAGESCDDGNAVDTDACRNNCTACGDGVLNGGEDCDGTQFEAGAPPTHGLCRTDCTYCGNGTPESPETCDDGNAVNTDACRNDCTSCGDGIWDIVEDCDGTQFEPGAPPTHGLCRTDCTYCGNGAVEAGETCDDGNAVDTDACRNNCTSCGDGILNDDEACDGTQFEVVAPPGHGPCRTDCTYCGNGAVEAGETCDDGNAVNTDACRNDCTFCGDGILNDNEDCDGTQFEAGAPPSHGACRTNCTYCGNGAVDAGETCDDGNAIDTDGCRNNCSNCGDGIVNGGEYCDDGNINNDDACRNDCTACGDAIVNGDEYCDDGNTVNTDACRNDCTACGDVKLNGGEDCDGTEFEAGAPPTHGPCRTNCTYCGNGTMESPETCDDGNAVNTDSCRNNCTMCGDGIKDDGEYCDGTQFEASVPPVHGPCRPNCTYCGNGVVEAGETCDPPGSPQPDGSICSASCIVCGDGILDDGEECEVGIECFVHDKPCKETICNDQCKCVKVPLPNGTIVSSGEECMDFVCQSGMPSDHPKPDGTTCGIAAPEGVCDTPDSCDGKGHCNSNYKEEGTICRAAVDVCDVPEPCSGLSGDCPPNTFAASGTQAADDGEECTHDVCDGQGHSVHPPKARGTPCGNQTPGICDLPDQCDGAGVCDMNIVVVANDCVLARMAKLVQCMRGPEVPYPDPSCFTVDLDQDNDVDHKDCSLMLN